METLKNYVHKNVPSFFQWQKRQLMLVGLNLPENTKHLTLFILYDIMLMSLTVVGLFVLEFTQIIIRFNDFKVLMINTAQFTLHFCSIIQIIIWFFVKKELFKVIDMIERPSFQFRTFSIESLTFVPCNPNSEDTDYEDLKFLKKTKINLDTR